MFLYHLQGLVSESPGVRECSIRWMRGIELIIITQCSKKHVRMFVQRVRASVAYIVECCGRLPVRHWVLEEKVTKPTPAGGAGTEGGTLSLLGLKGLSLRHQCHQPTWTGIRFGVSWHPNQHTSSRCGWRWWGWESCGHLLSARGCLYVWCPSLCPSVYVNFRLVSMNWIFLYKSNSGFSIFACPHSYFFVGVFLFRLGYNWTSKYVFQTLAMIYQHTLTRIKGVCLSVCLFGYIVFV